MIKALRTAIVIAAAAILPMGPAFADTSLGIYQTKERDVDFELFLCGPDETLMCIYAREARGKARNQRVLPMLGTYIVQNAKPNGTNKWRGAVHYLGHSMVGGMTLWPGDRVTMSGCAYVFFCDDLTLYAAETAPAQ